MKSLLFRSENIFAARAVAIFAFVCATFLAAQLARADAERPYKATTVDECIQEKECVWYAFSGLATRIKIPMSYKPPEEHRIRKWKRAAQATFATPDDNTRRYTPFLQELGTQIQPYFPYDLFIPKPPNVFIFYSRDFKKDIEGVYKKDVHDIFMRDFGADGYKKLLQKNRQCFSYMKTYGQDRYEIGMAFIFVNPDKNPEKCVRSQFMSILGLDAYYKDFPFSVTGPNHDDFTKMDLFLIELLYKPEIKPGMASVELRQVFDRIYYPSLVPFTKKYNSENVAGRSD